MQAGVCGRRSLILAACQRACWLKTRVRVGALQSIPVLKAEGVEPASYRKSHDAFKEGIVIFADSKGIEFPEEVQPLMTPSDNLLCIGRESAEVVKDSAHVFVLLNYLHWLPVNVGGDCSNQFPLPTGEGHRHLFFCFFFNLLFTSTV